MWPCRSNREDLVTTVVPVTYTPTHTHIHTYARRPEPNGRWQRIRRSVGPPALPPKVVPLPLKTF